MNELALFVRESNWIEGIRRDPLPEEIQAHKFFLEETTLDIPLLEHFVSKIQPGAKLRRYVGMDVRVGKHIAPEGGAMIPVRLESLINQVNAHEHTESFCYMIHRDYETLHPFIDGNGRSGRVLWLRMMGGPEKVPLGFLHTWYYQSLQNGR